MARTGAMWRTRAATPSSGRRPGKLRDAKGLRRRPAWAREDEAEQRTRGGSRVPVQAERPTRVSDGLHGPGALFSTVSDGMDGSG